MEAQLDRRLLDVGRPKWLLRISPFVAFWYGMSSAFLLILNRAIIESLSLQSISMLAGILSLIGICVTAWSSSEGLWAVQSVYLVVYSLFHFGAVVVFSIGQLSDNMYEVIDGWFFGPYAPTAIFLAMMGVCAYIVGASLPALLTKRPADQSLTGMVNDKLESKHEATAHSITIVGSSLVIASVVYWFFVAISSGGPSIFTSSYGNYLAVTQGRALAYVQLALAIGICFTAVGQSDRSAEYQRAAYVAFGLFVLAALPIGLRGEVLIPLMAALAVSARNGRAFSIKTSALFAAIVLSLISLVREIRQVGIGGLKTTYLDGNVFDALAEMGNTLRPVAVVIGWVSNGEPQLEGASYWAPIERALCTLTPFTQCLPSSEDYRLMNVVVSQRVGNIGFSPIAEAYFNFGIVGVAAVMLIVGITMGLLTRLRRTPTANAAAGVVLVVLLYNVRNAFVPVPVHLGIGMTVLILALLLREYSFRGLARESSFVAER